MSIHALPSLAELVRRFRITAGLSQEKLAERSGLSPRQISDLERGQRKLPRLETICMLAEGLELSELDRSRLLAAARPDMPGIEVAPAALDGYRASLPSSHIRLIGREQELASIAELLTTANARLVTLTGPGGVGKTQLALQAAGLAAASFAGGAASVDLIPITDPELVASAIAQTLGIADSGVAPIRQALGLALASRRLLLLIDNVEHVIDAAPLLSELLDAAPGLQILATSRERLRIREETEFVVAPLALPADADQADLERLGSVASVELFVASAMTARDGFALSPENTVPVAEICRRLDGLPLALELAAAQVKLFPPAVLVRYMNESLPFLVGGPRDVHTRQQTLRNTIAWSHDLLTGSEQIVFRHLGAFAGGASLEALGTVVARAGLEPIELLPALTSLVDKHLVQSHDDFSGQPRFSMLETIREFAVDQLALHGDAERAREAHTHWFVDLAERIYRQIPGDQEPHWLNRSALEHANFRLALSHAMHTPNVEAALQLAGALWPLWFRLGHLAEGRRWLDDALRSDTAGSPAILARALRTAGQLAHFQGDDLHARPLLERALELFRGLDDPAGLGSTLLMLGIVFEDTGDYRNAETLIQDAQHWFSEAGDPGLYGLTVYHLGITAVGLGDLDRAMHQYELALDHARRHQIPFNIATTQHYLSLAACETGDLGRAAEANQEALAIDEAENNVLGIMSDLANIAVLAVHCGQFHAAARLFGTADALLQRINALPYPLPERASYERAMDTAKNALGLPAFDEEWSAGTQQSLDDSYPDIDLVLAAAGAPIR